MGKSVRSKREKHLRTIKRTLLDPVESVSLSVRSNKLTSIINNERAALVDSNIDFNEITNSNKSKPYTFNFLAAKKYQQSISNSNSNNNNNTNNTTMANTDSTANSKTRGRDRTIKPNTASKLLATMTAATGSIVKPESIDMIDTDIADIAADSSNNNSSKVSYVELGTPSHQRRSIIQRNNRESKQSETNSRARSKSRSGKAGIVANWFKL